MVLSTIFTYTNTTGCKNKDKGEYIGKASTKVVQTPERIFMHDEADRQTDRQAS
jgi:hypothetical protein